MNDFIPFFRLFERTSARGMENALRKAGMPNAFPRVPAL